MPDEPAQRQYSIDNNTTMRFLPPPTNRQNNHNTPVAYVDAVGVVGAEQQRERDQIVARQAALARDVGRRVPKMYCRTSRRDYIPVVEFEACFATANALPFDGGVGAKQVPIDDRGAKQKRIAATSKNTTNTTIRRVTYNTEQQKL